MEALKLEQLYIRRGNFLIRDVNFSVEEGQICAIAGKGGSGKSSLIHAVGGAIHPQVGRILYDGRQLYEAEEQIRKEMSVVYDAPNFNTEMKPEKLVRELMKFEPWFDRETFSIYMEQLELDPKLRVKLYSEGMQRKLMLILALCRGPKLLVMDEPTSGVDRQSRKVMWELLMAYKKEKPLTVLFTTHHGEEIKQADRVFLMQNGTGKEARDETIL